MNNLTNIYILNIEPGMLSKFHKNEEYHLRARMKLDIIYRIDLIMAWITMFYSYGFFSLLYLFALHLDHSLLPLVLPILSFQILPLLPAPLLREGEAAPSFGTTLP